MKCMKIRIKDNRCKKLFIDKIFKTKHLENILLILLNQDYKMNEGKHRKHLLDSNVMRALITDTKGSEKKQETIQYMKDYYKNNQLMSEFIAVGKELKIHNIVEQIKDIKKNYNVFYTKVKKGDKDAKPPKPKKLKKCNHITLFCDGYKSHSFAKKNRIGININSKMKYIYVKHQPILDVVGSFDNVKNINLNYSNGYIYLLINYENEPKSLGNKSSKVAGLDIGINNLASVYINDLNTPSLIVDGTPYKNYNTKFNRFIANLSNEIDFWHNYINDETKKHLNEGLHVLSDIEYLNKFKSFLYEKRNNYYYSEFHKISKRILEYLYINNVGTLVVSSNLANLKNNGNCEMRKDVKQNFIQIPFMQLIKNLKDKAPKFGITIVDVDESYTSKTSCLSANIVEIKKRALNNEKLSTNDFKGSRVKRGMFKDKVLNKTINADLNGACNILKIVDKFIGDINYLKFCNPIKCKSDHELTAVIAGQ